MNGDRSTLQRHDFRDLMTEFPTGVAVVTVTDEQGEPRGMTCSSMCSVTLRPPTLLVCIRSASPTLHVLLARGRFAVNLIHQEAQDTAELFASGLAGRFGLVAWDEPPGAAGPHLVEAAHATADCRVTRADRVGDHVVVFGEAEGITVRDRLSPLLYGRRQYRRWSPGQGAVARAG